MKNFICLFFAFVSIHLSAQSLIDYNYLGSYTKGQITSSFGHDAKYDVALYKVQYYTNNIEGESHLASGLFCLPDNPNEMPLLCYQHGTVNGRFDVPSELAGGFSLGVVFASEGYATVLPDYIGLGDSPGIHPYIHAESEAWAGLDLFRAAREMQEAIAFTLNDKIFITGYSQGGHASMALQRMIERDQPEGFAVTAGGHCSGPYSVSEKMIEFTLGEEPYVYVSYLAWVALSILTTFPDLLAAYELEDIFVADIVPFVEQFRDEEINLADLNTLMLQWLLLNNPGGFQARELLHDSIVDVIFNDPSHPISRAFQRNDLLDWSPQEPTRLFYCTNDDQVTFENAVYADSILNALGAIDLEAIDVASNEDHGGCVDPAIRATIEFFNSFADFSINVNNLLNACDFSLIQKQQNLEVTAHGPCEFDKIASVDVYDTQGNKIVAFQANAANSYDISQLNNGVFFVTLNTLSGQTLNKKFWKH